MQHPVRLPLLLKETLILVSVSAAAVVQRRVHQLEGPSSRDFLEEVVEEAFRVKVRGHVQDRAVLLKGLERVRRGGRGQVVVVHSLRDEVGL
jgi:hypothetical protein